jgi:Na+/H+ antiporter NhaD and related arsenite permeases
MRTGIIGAGLLLLGLVAVVTGILPPMHAFAVWNRVWPVLLFVVAITIVAELAAEAGLFDRLAANAAIWGAGRAWLLLLVVALIAAVGTIFLSLDTTAVLLTPIVVVLARRCGLNPLPFALMTVWLANTASLLLPVSNLTNLLAQSAMGGGVRDFVGHTWAPSIIAIVIPAAAVFLIYRRTLKVRYRAPSIEPIGDRVLFASSAVVVGALLPALVSGAPVWTPAVAAAALLCVVFAVRRRSVLRPGLVPWSLLLFACGLFLCMAALSELGLDTLLSRVSGAGEDPLELLRLAAVSAIGANGANNLPAYLALETVAGSPVRITAVLIGVNAGVLITPWASLATMLWHARLRRLGVSISWTRFVGLGLFVAPFTVVIAALALAALG